MSMPLNQLHHYRSAEMQRAKAGREDGSLTVFALVALVGMVGIGGLAVDTMNYEAKRVATQDALDRCALMSSLAQNRIDGGATTDTTAKAVAEDCMGKSEAGAEGLHDPVISTNNSERSTTLSGSFTFDGLFPNATGAGNSPTKTFALSAQSKQKLPNLEISIAIDTTHTVFWTALRDPLKVFLNTIAAPDTGNKVSVNIVPYGSSVYLGTTLLERFNDTNKPPFSNTDARTCLNFSPTERGELGITYADPYIWSWPLTLAGTGYAGTSWETVEFQSNIYNDAAEATAAMNGAGSCARQTNALAIAGNTPLIGVQVTRPVSATASTTINNKLNAIVPTSFVLGSIVDTTGGLKWALAALDPSLKPVIAGQVTAGTSPAAATGRPRDYTAADTMKVLLFFTNSAFATSNYAATELQGGQFGREIKPEYLGDTPSTIWRTPGPATVTQPVRLSVFHDNAPDPTRPYWVSQGLSTNPQPPSENAQWMAVPYQHPGGGTPVRLTWGQAMSQITLFTIIRQLYMAPFSPVTNSTNTWSALVERFTYIARDSAKDRENFAALCAAAKQEGVLIYMLRSPGSTTVSASTPGQAAHNTNVGLANPIYNACATSSAHAFTLSTTNIRSTLRMIASNIAQLTLTQ